MWTDTNCIKKTLKIHLENCFYKTVFELEYYTVHPNQNAWDAGNFDKSALFKWRMFLHSKAICCYVKAWDLLCFSIAAALKFKVKIIEEDRVLYKAPL